MEVVVLNWQWFCLPEDICQCLETFWWPQLGVLLASSYIESSLQHTGCPLPIKNDPDQNGNSSEVEKSWIRAKEGRYLLNKMNTIHWELCTHRIRCSIRNEFCVAGHTREKLQCHHDYYRGDPNPDLKVILKHVQEAAWSGLWVYIQFKDKETSEVKWFKCNPVTLCKQS